MKNPALDAGVTFWGNSEKFAENGGTAIRIAAGAEYESLLWVKVKNVLIVAIKNLTHFAKNLLQF